MKHIHKILFLANLIIIISVSCRKELELDTIKNPQNKFVARAKTFFDAGKAKKEYARRAIYSDTVDLFYYLQLNWDSAKIAVSSIDSFSFVKVPVILASENIGLLKDSISIDLIFYDSDSCGLEMEMWAYPFNNSNYGPERSHIYNGKVAVLNHCYFTSQIFNIENGVVYNDSLTIDTARLFNNLVVRKFDPKCYSFRDGDGLFGTIGLFFKNLFKGIFDFFGHGSNGSNNSGGHDNNWSGPFFWSNRGDWINHNNNWFEPGTFSGWSGSGGSGGSRGPDGTHNNDLGSYYIRFSAYFSYLYGIDLLMDYEDIVFKCKGSENQSYESFEACVFQELDNYVKDFLGINLYNQLPQFGITLLGDKLELCKVINDFDGKYGIKLTESKYGNIALICASSNDFDKCAIEAVALLKDTELKALYLNYVAENVDINSIIAQHGAQVYLASAMLFETYMQEIGIPPTNPYIYQLAMEQFLKNVGPILLSFVPLVGAYQDFHDGSYFSGSLSLILDLAGPLKAVKIVKYEEKLKDGWKVYKAVKEVIIKIIDAGGNKVLNNLPDSWKSQVNRTFLEEAENKGWIWTNPSNSNHHIRAMSGNPSSPYPHSRNPYIKMHKGNSFYDKYGNPVNPANFPLGINDPNYNDLIHIPLAEAIESSIIDFFN